MRLLDLVLPQDCAGCGDPAGAVCVGCRRALAGPARSAWPTPAPAGLPPPWAAAGYDGPVRQLLLAAKERGVLPASRALGAALGLSVAASTAAGCSRPVWLVPVPSTRAAIRRRGDDVVLAMARRAAAVAREAGVEARVLPVLRHNRQVADSAGLGSRERARNLSGAFSVRRHPWPAAERPVVVVDDLITTGATLAEAARALRSSGLTVTGCATVAATPRRAGTTVLG